MRVRVFFFVTCSCALFKKNLPPAKNLFSIRIDARFQRFFCVAGVCSELGGFKLTLFAFHLMEWIVCPYHRFPPVRLYNFGSNWISNDRDRHTTHKHWRLFSKHSPRGTYLSISSANGEEAVTFKQQQTPHCRHPVIPPHLHSHTIPLSLFKHGLFTTDRPGTRSDAFDFS